jgi:PIN domain nuclease of toxin-antitoxin system
MKWLLDTCTFLWFITKSSKLSADLYKAISDPEREIFLSVVSTWEIVIKNQLGKLTLPDRETTQYIKKAREHHMITSLMLTEDHIDPLSKLPLLHEDPFDRILICQAMDEGMALITPDKKISQYPVKIIW